MPNPSSSRESAGDPIVEVLAAPSSHTGGADAEHPVLFHDVSWDDYEAMLRIRGERRFRITYNRGFMEVVFPGQHERLSAVSWDDYEAMLRIVGDGSLRVIYDRGEMELIMPSYRHEAWIRLFQTLMTDLLRAARIPFMSGGSTNLRREPLARGLEPDLCYFLRDLDRLSDPLVIGSEGVVPDLAIEIEVSRSSLDKLAIYAALGVPEVWRFDGQAFAVHRLRADGTYEAVPTSVGLPQVSTAAVAIWLQRGIGRDEMAWGEQVLDWVRQGMPALGQEGADGPGGR